MNEDFITSKMPLRMNTAEHHNVQSISLESVFEVNQEADNKMVLEEDTSLHPRIQIQKDKAEDIKCDKYHHVHNVKETLKSQDSITEEKNEADENEPINKPLIHHHIEAVIDKVEDVSEKVNHEIPKIEEITPIEEEKEDSEGFGFKHCEEKLPRVDEVRDASHSEMDTLDIIDESEEIRRS
jgi:hypothetical protein